MEKKIKESQIKKAADGISPKEWFQIALAQL